MTAAELAPARTLLPGVAADFDAADRRNLAAWADESSQDEHGEYHVAVCHRGVPGFRLMGRGRQSLSNAQLVADRMNEQWGHSPAEVMEIRASSMAASLWSEEPGGL